MRHVLCLLDVHLSLTIAFSLTVVERQLRLGLDPYMELLRERTKVFVALRFAVGGHPEAANFNYESSDAGPLTDYTKKVTRLAGSNGSSYEIR
ncbi:hypothetical protein V1477_000933 [Vespula maculifrons]|uniref:Uncharacterized protein n=2 Tax=Vespula TaxID=7451 RepID=A0A834JBY2_VESVU|nr:hypothetical protein HZH66_012489 [Vespula vulgaris]